MHSRAVIIAIFYRHGLLSPASSIPYPMSANGANDSHPSDNERGEEMASTAEEEEVNGWGVAGDGAWGTATRGWNDTRFTVWWGRWPDEPDTSTWQERSK